jgi:hypothetical protein
MPLSTDNQDYGEKDKKNESAENTDNAKSSGSASAKADKLTSDDLKGKKVDADLSKETDKPANQ